MDGLGYFELLGDVLLAGRTSGCQSRWRNADLDGIDAAIHGKRVDFAQDQPPCIEYSELHVHEAVAACGTKPWRRGASALRD